jgi:hypothetical protein
MKKSKEKQLDFVLRTWGGARPGGGPKRKTNELPHRARPDLDGRVPVHVTLRIMRGLPNLRTKSTFKEVKAALAAGADRCGFRLVH